MHVWGEMVQHMMMWRCMACQGMAEVVVATSAVEGEEETSVGEAAEEVIDIPTHHALLVAPSLHAWTAVTSHAPGR